MTQARKPRAFLQVALLFAAAGAVYSNHFHNGFHFDDWHTVTRNPWVRDLGNIPRFFTDGRTASVMPSNRVYRPLLSLSLAVDYGLGGGLKPGAFHTTTFLAFLGLLAAVFFLFRRVMDLAERGFEGSHAWPALLAAAWFGLHPACAETVNYVIQRADVYVALAVTTGVLLYSQFPERRRRGYYLAPVALGFLFKTTAVMFAPILAVYALLFEEETPGRAFRRTVPALALSAGLLALVWAMTPATFHPANTPVVSYLITQPWVTLHYFLMFFAPVSLTADTDMKAFPTPWNPECLAGFVFVGALAALAWRLGRERRTRPAAFGLWWFLLAGLPTAVMPLAEVANDHRMFAPFIGLALAATWGMRLAWLGRKPRPTITATVAAVVLLAGYGAGAHARNRVWATEESLWGDVVRKSPANGRGLMNYGLALMEKGDFPGALGYFHRAERHIPNYYILQINFGSAYAGLREEAEAERRFRRAMALAPEESLPLYYYARWLRSRGRNPEAFYNLRRAAALNPTDEEARSLLAEMDRPGNLAAAAAGAEAAARAAQSAGAYVGLSMVYYQAGRFEECVGAAREALRLKPDSADAYNNMAAGYKGMGRWDEAIAAAAEALKLRPDFAVARSNLEYAEKMKAEEGRP